MDPNANLQEQLKLAEAIQSSAHRSDEYILSDALRLAELVEALDGWITKKGFPPDRWVSSFPAG